ncbi:hypothetical protein K8I61_02140 [bacterium]|nr:hypothetical protein [bacterium]
MEVRSVKQKDTPYSCQDLEIGECYVGCEYDWFDCVEEQCDGNHVLEWCVFDDDSHGWKGAEPQYDEYCDCANEACKLDRINCFLACDTDTEIRCPSCNDGDLDDDATDDDSAADDDDTGAAGDDDDDDSGKSACGG